MNVSLVMVQADGSKKEIPVPKLPAVIGRDEGVRVRVPLAAVSRRHCEITEADDELVIRDLKSSNGTYVNGERVKSRELVPGDLLAVGSVVFVVRIDGFPKDIDAADSYAAGAVPIGPGIPGSGNAPTAIAGVPTWGGAAAAAGGAAAGAAKSSGGPAKANGGDAAPAGAPKKDPKKDDDDEDTDFSDLLEGLDLDDDDDK